MARSIDPRRIEVLDEATARMYRNKTVTERVALVFDAHRTAKSLVEAHLRHIHPEWDDARVHSEVVRRMLGTE